MKRCGLDPWVGKIPWRRAWQPTSVFLLGESLQCMKVKSESEVAQSGPTLCDPIDGSPSGSSVHGIFQARVLEWGAIAFSAKTTDMPQLSSS